MQLLRVVAALALCATSARAHAVGSLADVRIEDRASGRELPVYRHEGRSYVVGQPGHEYRIVMRNRAGEDLLAVVSVDGVNALSGATARADQGGYVLAPWRRVEIAGWRKSLDEVAAFYFTSLRDSYAGRMGRPANVGVFGVALFRRAAPPAPPIVQHIEGSLKDQRSSNDAQRAKVLPSAAAPLATGHGRREESPVRYVEFERASAEPCEVVTIYYDSRANLVAQGVIPGPRFAPRDPNPFPAGFVPDPR
jgi:hypothetical protein